MKTRNFTQQLLTVVGMGILACTALPAMGNESAEAQAETTPSGANPFASLPRYHHVPLCPREGHQRYCKAWVRTDANGIRSFAAAPQGFGADDLAKAYNLDTTLKPNATIAIVDAYGYPNADKDLQVYRAQYKLPPCTVANKCLTIVNQMGQTTPLPAPNAGWEGETALDLDMASAACPNCKILLVQADNETGDGLNICQATAASLGATVISNSWGGAETGGPTGLSQEHFFMLSTPATIFVASGDSGYDNGGAGQGQQGSDYPSTSAFVIGVGGTSLMQDASTRGWSEQAWSSGGSSCGTSVATPSWQSGVKTDCGMRAAADVSAVGDPQTGVAVYQGGWQVVGGTSASSPLVAGIFALTGNGAAGPAAVYKHPTIWNDVTQGSNDQGVTGAFGCPSATSVLCNAGVGWDGPTGWGTPNGAQMMKLGGGGPPPDMATPLDMTRLPDLSPPPPPPDLARPVDAATGGVGGNGANPGNGFTGGNANKGCGCTLGGAPGRDSGALALGGLFFGWLLSRRRRRA